MKIEIEIVFNFTFFSICGFVFDLIGFGSCLQKICMCSALLCFANYWCLWAWVFVCVSLRLCFVFVSAKMIISGKSELLYSVGLFFLCVLTLLLFWVFGMRGYFWLVEVHLYWSKSRDGTVLSSSVPFACLCTFPCVDSWKWFMRFVWVACLLLHVLCDVVVSRFCVDGDGLCMPCQKLRWNSAD